jgi:hypothetical protein
MKVLFITGDMAAMGGIIGLVTHILPEAAGTIAAILGGLWYSVMLYDRLVKKKDDYKNQ